MNSLNDSQLIHTGPEMFEAGLPYRVQMPDGPGPYPTAVMVHGRLGNEDVMWVFRKVVPRPWLVVAPRAIYADHDLYSWHIQQPDEWATLADFDPAVAALSRFMHAMTRLYNADPDRMYLMGFSQGAAVSMALALRHPQLARGLAALVGFAPTATAEAVDGRLAGLPVFMAAGTEDETIPYDVTQRSLALLEQSGADLAYHEYQTGHKLNAAGMNDLRAWFNAQR